MFAPVTTTAHILHPGKQAHTLGLSLGWPAGPGGIVGDREYARDVRCASFPHCPHRKPLMSGTFANNLPDRHKFPKRNAVRPDV